eukprot:6846916-Lingulodinium_polyedra.AAC.1
MESHGLLQSPDFTSSCCHHNAGKTISRGHKVEAILAAWHCHAGRAADWHGLEQRMSTECGMVRWMDGWMDG